MKSTRRTKTFQKGDIVCAALFTPGNGVDYWVSGIYELRVGVVESLMSALCQKNTGNYKYRLTTGLVVSVFLCQNNNGLNTNAPPSMKTTYELFIDGNVYKYHKQMI